MRQIVAIFRAYDRNERVIDCAPIRHIDFRKETFKADREVEASRGYHLEAICDDAGHIYDIEGNIC